MEKGKYKFRITAENELAQVTKTFKVKLLRASPTIITSSLPEGYTGVAYETYLEAQGTDPIKWSKIGKLPSGLKLNKNVSGVEAGNDSGSESGASGGCSLSLLGVRECLSACGGSFFGVIQSSATR